MNTVLRTIMYVIIAILTTTLTIAGFVIFLSAIDNGIYEFVGGLLMLATGMWLMFFVYKGKLQKTTRITGGILLACLSLVCIIAGIDIIFIKTSSNTLLAGGVASIVFGGTLVPLIGYLLCPKFMAELEGQKT